MHDFVPRTAAAGAVNPRSGPRPLRMVARVLVLAGWGVVALGAALLILGGAVVAAAAALALGSVRAGAAVGTRLTARPRVVSRRPAELPSILPRRLG